MARSAPLVPGGAAGRLLGTGIVLGVAAGAAWVVAKRGGQALGEHASRDEAQNPRLINWQWARTIARRTALGGVAESAPAEQERARQEYAALVERSADLVSRYTGIALPAPLTQVYIFDRVQWVDANLAQFEMMFAPLDEAYAHAVARTRRAGPVGGIREPRDHTG